jgi:P27 family predicted phage terminase small subunit
MVGRKPKPTKLKLLQGNAGHRKIKKNEPKPKEVMPECPPFLDDIAKEEWNRFSGVLNDLGLLTEIDGTEFAGYCLLYSRLVQIRNDLKQQQIELNDARSNLKRLGDEESLLRLSRLPVSVLTVYDYTVDPLGNEHLKQSQNPLIIMERQILQLIRSFCTDYGMNPSSRGRIQIPEKPPKKDEAEDFLREGRK